MRTIPRKNVATTHPDGVLLRAVEPASPQQQENEDTPARLTLDGKLSFIITLTSCVPHTGFGVPC